MIRQDACIQTWASCEAHGPLCIIPHGTMRKSSQVAGTPSTRLAPRTTCDMCGTATSDKALSDCISRPGTGSVHWTLQAPSWRNAQRLHAEPTPSTCLAHLHLQTDRQTGHNGPEQLLFVSASRVAYCKDLGSPVRWARASSEAMLVIPDFIARYTLCCNSFVMPLCLEGTARPRRPSLTTAFV